MSLNQKENYHKKLYKLVIPVVLLVLILSGVPGAQDRGGNEHVRITSTIVYLGMAETTVIRKIRGRLKHLCPGRHGNQ